MDNIETELKNNQEFNTVLKTYFTNFNNDINLVLKCIKEKTNNTLQTLDQTAVKAVYDLFIDENISIYDLEKFEFILLFILSIKSFSNLNAGSEIGITAQPKFSKSKVKLSSCGISLRLPNSDFCHFLLIDKNIAGKKTYISCASINEMIKEAAIIISFKDNQSYVTTLSNIVGDPQSVINYINQ